MKLFISEFIPQGKENAITRDELARVTGLPDRTIREYIALERRHTPILNAQDGKGYYRPLPSEYLEAKEFLKQEEHRAKSIFWSLCGLRKWLKENSNN